MADINRVAQADVLEAAVVDCLVRDILLSSNARRRLHGGYVLGRLNSFAELENNSEKREILLDSLHLLIIFHGIQAQMTQPVGQPLSLLLVLLSFGPFEQAAYHVDFPLNFLPLC